MITKVYPELADGSGGNKSITKSLDDLLEESNIEQAMLNRLGENMVSSVKMFLKWAKWRCCELDSEFPCAKGASQALNDLTQAYQGASDSANSMSSGMNSFNEVMQLLLE